MTAMPMDENEKKKFLQVPLCTEGLVDALESVGIRSFDSLKGLSASELVTRINTSAGHKLLGGPVPVMALNNLIDRAEGRY